MAPALFIVALTAAAPPGLTQTVEDQPEGPQWTLSMQAGGGRLSEDPVAMFRPRVTLEGSQLRVALAAPLFLKISDESPTADSRTMPVTWQNDWSDFETYAAWIEDLAYRSKRGAIQLRAGGLRRQTLGHGTLVDDYTGSYDPSMPRSGVDFVVTTDVVEAKLITDGLVRPRLVAASIAIAPFQIDDRAAGEPLTVALEVATDMRAPITQGTTQIGGADIVVTGAPYVGDELMWSLYGSLGSFFTETRSGALGTHIGTELNWVRGREALLLRVEATVAGAGYDPSYFDDQYAAERNALDRDGATSKAMRVAPAGYGTRGRVEFQTGPLTLGTSVEHSFARAAENPTRASLYGELTSNLWHVGMRVSQRAMRDSGDWFAMGTNSMAILDAAVRIHEEWFAYTLLHHGIRAGDDGIVTPVSDWVIGVGYGMAGTLNRL